VQRVTCSVVVYTFATNQAGRILHESHLESLVEDEGVRQVSVLEDDRVASLVAVEFRAVLFDEGLGMQEAAFLPVVSQGSEVVLVNLVVIRESCVVCSSP